MRWTHFYRPHESMSTEEEVWGWIFSSYLITGRILSEMYLIEYLNLMLTFFTHFCLRKKNCVLMLPCVQWCWWAVQPPGIVPVCTLVPCQWGTVWLRGSFGSGPQWLPVWCSPPASSDSMSLWFLFQHLAPQEKTQTSDLVIKKKLSLKFIINFYNMTSMQEN